MTAGGPEAHYAARGINGPIEDLSVPYGQIVNPLQTSTGAVEGNLPAATATNRSSGEGGTVRNSCCSGGAMIRSGDVDPAFAIFARFQQRNRELTVVDLSPAGVLVEGDMRLLAFDAACFASGLMDVEGLSESELAKRHRVTRAAFSKLVVQWVDIEGPLHESADSVASTLLHDKLDQMRS